MTGILLAHYGAAQTEALEKTVFALEREAKAAFPEWAVEHCFTSERMLALLRRQGEGLLSVDEALKRFQQKGCCQVVMQPTHLITGAEYERLRQRALLFQKNCPKLILGTPFLEQVETQQELREFFEKLFPLKERQAVVFVGHGGSSMKEYEELAACFRGKGRSDVFIGLLKGGPDAERLGRELKRTGFLELLLVPLLFAAGTHVFRDIAGDAPESWKSRLENQGFAVQAVPTGLGEYPAVRQMYLNRIRQLAGE